MKIIIFSSKPEREMKWEPVPGAGRDWGDGGVVASRCPVSAHPHQLTNQPCLPACFRLRFNPPPPWLSLVVSLLGRGVRAALAPSQTSPLQTPHCRRPEARKRALAGLQLASRRLPARMRHWCSSRGLLTSQCHLFFPFALAGVLDFIYLDYLAPFKPAWNSASPYGASPFPHALFLS